MTYSSAFSLDFSSMVEYRCSMCKPLITGSWAADPDPSVLVGSISTYICKANVQEDFFWLGYVSDL